MVTFSDVLFLFTLLLKQMLIIVKWLNIFYNHSTLNNNIYLKYECNKYNTFVFYML